LIVLVIYRCQYLFKIFLRYDNVPKVQSGTMRLIAVKTFNPTSPHKIKKRVKTEQN